MPIIGPQWVESQTKICRELQPREAQYARFEKKNLNIKNRQIKTQHFIMGLQGEVEEIDYKEIHIYTQTVSTWI